jgi:hypothetical protein
MWRKCFLVLVFLAVFGKGGTAQETCKDCDCYHPPVASTCEKCCHVFIGTIKSVDEHKFVLRSKDASGNSTEKTFSYNLKTRKLGDLKPGDSVKVYFKKEGDHNLATAVETHTKEKL